VPAPADGGSSAAVEFGLAVRDVAESLRFWQGALGFQPFGQIDAPGGVHVLGLRRGASAIKLRWVDGETEAEADASPFSSHYITVHVADARRVEAACAERGFTVLKPCFPITLSGGGECIVGFVVDPDNHRVEILQGWPWGPLNSTAFNSDADGARPVHTSST